MAVKNLTWKQLVRRVIVDNFPHRTFTRKELIECAIPLMKQHFMKSCASWDSAVDKQLSSAVKENVIQRVSRGVYQLVDMIIETADDYDEPTFEELDMIINGDIFGDDMFI